MKVIFEDDDLGRLETDGRFDGGWSQAIVKAFRKRIQFFRAAVDERDFYAMRSLNFEKLKRSPNEYSVRLNDQWRLVFGFSGEAPNKTIVVIAIEDYH